MIGVIEKFNKVSSAKNIPVSSMFELTKRCNLRCVHCYLKSACRNEGKEELSTLEVFDVLDQLAESGSLYILFTGGEIFLRNDFFDILSYAQKKHFAIVIFTNGTLITSDCAKKLSRYNLINVGVSLYSMDSSIHDEITGVSGSWEKTISGIKFLRRLDVSVEIKTPLMKQNFYGYQKIIELADNIGAKYSFDLSIVPCDDGNGSPLKYRVEEDEIYKFLSTQKIFNYTTDKNNFICTAGKNVCAVKSNGDVYPCLQFLVKFGNLEEKRFGEIWHNRSNRAYLPYKLSDLPSCKKCNYINYCGRCPGLAQLEDGDIKGPWYRACQIAKIANKFKPDPGTSLGQVSQQKLTAVTSH